MQIILLEKVINVGNLGDVVKVKQGYARNYLIPQGKAKRATPENIKLLADFYHLSVNGDDVAAVIEKHAKDFGHIQIADNPGRGAPGTGELPLGEWIARSRQLGYEGYIGLEYKEPAETAFAWAIRQRVAP